MRLKKMCVCENLEIIMNFMPLFVNQTWNLTMVCFDAQSKFRKHINA